MLVRILTVQLLRILSLGVDVPPVLTIDEEVEQPVAIEVDPVDLPAGTATLVDADFRCNIPEGRPSSVGDE